MATRATREVAAEKTPPRSWVFLLVRNALLWVVPVALLWMLLTPVYNRFLLESAQNLVHLTEYPTSPTCCARTPTSPISRGATSRRPGPSSTPSG